MACKWPLLPYTMSLASFSCCPQHQPGRLGTVGTMPLWGPAATEADSCVALAKVGAL